LVVPVYDAADEDFTWPAESEPLLSLEMLRALEQSGHTVKSRRHFLPLDAEGGRRVIVPVDQVEIVPVSNGPYQ
jgi:hypothetical protein